LADTEEMKRQCYGLVYESYLEKFKIDPTDYPEKIIFDKYDSYSLHCLITHIATGLPAACVRLVPFSQEEPFPFETLCAESLDTEKLEQLVIDPQKTCEIARLAVGDLFRKRSKKVQGHLREIQLSFSEEEKQVFALTSVVGFIAALVLAEISGKTGGFVMVESFLLKSLRRTGLPFQRVGADITYGSKEHIQGAPYFVTTQLALDNMLPDFVGIYHWVKDNVKLD